jgi:hypothetical protein
MAESKMHGTQPDEVPPPDELLVVVPAVVDEALVDEAPLVPDEAAAELRVVADVAPADTEFWVEELPEEVFPEEELTAPPPEVFEDETPDARHSPLPMSHVYPD